jgi:FkbM family methyltransferase
MAGRTKLFLQRLAGRLGYQIRRLEAGVSCENALTEQVRLVGHDAQVIIEVGAADGRDAEQYAELFPKARIVAVEPVPESYAKLARRKDRVERLTAVHAALSSQAGKSEFHVGQWADASSLLPAKVTGSNYDTYTTARQTIEVDTITLDSLCHQHDVTDVDLLKMDVQGAEMLILSAAHGLLQRAAIRTIYTEVQFTPCYEGASQFHDIAHFLCEHGFRLHNLYHLIRDHRGRLLWGDAIFLHNAHHPLAA